MDTSEMTQTLEQREAGRQLDAEIAELVLGWKWTMDECECPELNEGRCTRPDGIVVHKFLPSRDIAAAFQVVDAMQRRFPGMRFSLLGGDEQWGYTDTGVTDYDGRAVYVVDKSRRFVFGWRARFFGEQDPTRHTPFSWSDEHADTVPLAICRAALKAIEATAPQSAVEALASSPSSEDRNSNNG